MAGVAHLIALVHAAGGEIERHGDAFELVADAPLPRDLVAQLRAAKPELLAYLHEPVTEPTLLADGRRLHRFRASSIPDRLCDLPVSELPRRLRAYGVDLVADGAELVIIEPWLSALPPELLQEAKAAAGEIIALLRTESRARIAAAQAASTEE
jgi:hypothetical protein